MTTILGPNGKPYEKPKELRAKFDLAQTSVENKKHWAAADQLSARAALSPAVRRVCRIRSRYEAENNSWYAGILRTAVNHIGGTGPRLQLLSDNEEANTRVEKGFQHWARLVDFAGKLRTAIEAYWRDGEVYLMRAYSQRHQPYTLDIRVIEADQVFDPYTASVYNDPYIDDGIYFDEQTNAIAYYVYDHHPGGNVPLSTMSGQWYSDSEVAHLYRADRPGQVHGIPRATPALQTLPIMRRQELATLYSAESAANFAMYLKTNSPTVDPAASPADFAEIELTRNMLTTLPEGWEIGQVEPKQPGPLYEMFQRQALMSFARCTNMPYTLASGTGKDANFSSFKGDMKNVWQPEVKSEQSRIEYCIVEPLLKWFFEATVFVPGLLDGLPPLNQVDHKWHWPPLPTLDEVQAAKAGAERLSTGQSSPTEEYAQSGRDWESSVVRMAQDYGVSVDEMKQALFKAHFGGKSSSSIDGSVQQMIDDAQQQREGDQPKVRDTQTEESEVAA